MNAFAFDHPLYRDSITVIDREAVEDDRGNEGWQDSEREVDGVNVQQVSSTEVVDGRAQVVTRLRVAGPPGLDITPTAQVRYRGVLYEVDARPAERGSLGGLLDHTEFFLKEVTG